LCWEFKCHTRTVSDPGHGEWHAQPAPDAIGGDPVGDGDVDARPRAARGILVGLLIAAAFWIVLLLVLLLIGVL
jgi:hypothetical protein